MSIRTYERLVVMMLFGFFATQMPIAAQEEHQHQAGESETQSGGHDVAAMAREGSGTSWLPDASPMYAIHRQHGPWMLMAHENLFVQFLNESGDRGDDQFGSINWIMGMAQREAGRGHVGLRGMFSLEPWTIGGCGYPDLLASGELCRGEKIHDRQHPHDLSMEISAEYDAPLAAGTRWQVYGAPAGEPALGPVAYPHRVSAMANPLAPIAHHWLDSTHISFGVVTGGIYGKRWKIETSAFNGREPDENRKNFDFGALDSVSGRVSLLPTANLSLQVSAGHLKEAEAGENGGPRVDVNKVTASATFHRVRPRSVWASTVGWGRNTESHHATNAMLLETAFTIADRHTWFGRLETVGKTPHDLDVSTTSDLLTVTKLQGGYTRYLRSARGFEPGLGVTVSVGIVPEELRPAYGSRANTGVGLFLTLRPAAVVMTTAAAVAGGGTMVMVQTAFDPSKLTCAAGFDPKSAANTTYEGKRFYFCSPEDRDKFLTDPKMSLSMMPPKQ